MANKYNFLESELNKINENLISLPPDEVKRNNSFLEEFLPFLISKMKEKDTLFNSMFSHIFYGGSYYDGLKVGKPEEYDLQLLLTIPKYTEPTIITSNIPGFVHTKLRNYLGFLRQPEAVNFGNLGRLLDEKYYLNTDKVTAWMQSILDAVLDDLPNSSDPNNIWIKVHKTGPASTLKIVQNSSGFKMDIDLVPCFVFDEKQWPTNFRPNPVKSKPSFFIVPKAPKNSPNGLRQQSHFDFRPDPARPRTHFSVPKSHKSGQMHRYFRLSFQEQERVLIDNKRTLKPTVKLLKKLRDNLGHHCIASYYIKNVVLWITDQKGDDFWNNSPSYVFMTVLKEYTEYILKGQIPYFWNKNENLLRNIKPATLTNFGNKLRSIINDIDRNINQPSIIQKYLY